MFKSARVCQAKGPRPTLVDLGNGVQVGLVGMEAEFERFHAEGCKPLPALGEELLGAIRSAITCRGRHGWKNNKRRPCCVIPCLLCRTVMTFAAPRLGTDRGRLAQLDAAMRHLLDADRIQPRLPSCGPKSCESR